VIAGSAPSTCATAIASGEAHTQKTPTIVTSLSGTTETATGLLHSCAIETSETVQCWGAGDLAALGSDRDLDKPVPVDGLSEVHSTRRVGCELGDAVARRASAPDTVMSVRL